MREHFIVDNSTTPDWEVIPLGPVDKEGRKVSLSTATADAYIEDIKYCPFCGEEL